jgi:hypothetical protein
MSTTRNYYDEETIIDRDGPLSFTNLETSMRKYFQNAADRFPKQNIVGFSQENFKRFYKLPKVRQLTDCLYNVAFGDLNFTDLGKMFIPEERNSKAVH